MNRPGAIEVVERAVEVIAALVVVIPAELPIHLAADHAGEIVLADDDEAPGAPAAAPVGGSLAHRQDDLVHLVEHPLEQFRHAAHGAPDRFGIDEQVHVDPVGAAHRAQGVHAGVHVGVGGDPLAAAGFGRAAGQLAVELPPATVGVDFERLRTAPGVPIFNDRVRPTGIGREGQLTAQPSREDIGPQVGKMMGQGITAAVSSPDLGFGAGDDVIEIGPAIFERGRSGRHRRVNRRRSHHPKKWVILQLAAPEGLIAPFGLEAGLLRFVDGFHARWLLCLVFREGKGPEGPEGREGPKSYRGPPGTWRTRLAY